MKEEIMFVIVKLKNADSLTNATMNGLFRVKEPAVYMYQPRKRYYKCACGSSYYYLGSTTGFKAIISCPNCKVTYYVDHFGDCSQSTTRRSPFSRMLEDEHLSFGSAHIVGFSPKFNTDSKGNPVEYSIWQLQDSHLYIEVKNFIVYQANYK